MTLICFHIMDLLHLRSKEKHAVLNQLIAKHNETYQIICLSVEERMRMFLPISVDLLEI